MKPFGLIVILNSNGNAEGDLFYDFTNKIALQNYIPVGSQSPGLKLCALVQRYLEPFVKPIINL